MATSLSCLTQSQRFLIGSCSRRLILGDAINNAGAASRSSHSSAKYLSVNSSILEQNETQKVKFSPQRFRDTSSAHIAARLSTAAAGAVFGSGLNTRSAIGMSFNAMTSPKDAHVPVYDQSHSCSLSSVMQTNVPQPFNANGSLERGHLSMPGGQWAQNDKYVSADLHEHHYKVNTATRRAKVE